MNRTSWLSWLVCASVLCLLLTAAAPIWAQEDPACEQACRDQESACIEACSEADDPVECEGTCQNAATECTENCQ